MFSVSVGSVVGSGAMLQAGKWWVRMPMRSLSTSRITTLGLTQSLTEMCIRNIPGSKERLAHKADNLTAMCEPIL
jgi:hypothetical protein